MKHLIKKILREQITPEQQRVIDNQKEKMESGRNEIEDRVSIDMALTLLASNKVSGEFGEYS